MEWYEKELDLVLKELATSEKGLSQEEVKRRVKEYGLNVLKKTKHISAVKLFLNQFKSFIVYVLIFAAVVSFLVGERIDGIAIGVIVVLNAMLGFIQEYKAEKAIEALKKLSAPKAKVRREGKVLEIDASVLVPGDMLIIEEGAFIPADARILSNSSLTVDESMLTGESLPVHKNADVLKKKAQVSSQLNMVFAGTIASRGRAEAVVIATGFKSELGKIAQKIQEIGHETTPLQRQLKYLGNHLTIGILVICMIVFGIEFLKEKVFVNAFVSAVALAVAAIPEGLPAIITITLALGTRRMLKQNALMRRLHAVETLGATSVICADKTGTITKNKMEVIQLFANNEVIDVNQKGFVHEGHMLDPKKFSKLFEIGVVCNNAVIDGPADPTEKALLLIAKKANLEFKVKREKEIPFSSEKKFMATIDETKEGTFTHYKGAPEVIIEKCNYILENNKVKVLSQTEKKKLFNQAETMAGSALRVLGFSYANVKKPKEIVFVGLMGMLDPPRDEVRNAIVLCKKAGIKVVMITGDHLLTASAIANQIGITGKAITGEEIDKCSADRFQKVCNEISVYARVSPEHKLKILACLQQGGNVVAMTGDGVNDALALKKANIGVATGSGTDVAKEASDMVLIDDNFASIVSAVKEGRGVYNNLKKFVHFLLACNAAEVLIIFVGLLLGLPIPLLALQILWVNLLTDGFPALALGIDPVSNEVMSNPPRSKNARIIEKKDLFRLGFQAVLLTAVTLGVYWWFLKTGDINLARTMAFSMLVIGEMAVALNYHIGGESLLEGMLFKNKWLWLAIGTSLGLQVLVVYGLNKIFDTVPLSITNWIVILACAIPLFLLNWVVMRMQKKAIRS